DELGPARGGGPLSEEDGAESRPVPPLIRRYIKTSFAFLIVGVLLGAYVSTAQFLIGTYPPRLLITAHVHLLLAGFMLMVVMGVATWMFPRPARDDVRYRPELAEAVYWLMTGSTCARALAEICAAYVDSSALRVTIALGGLGQAGGVLLFVVNMWTRVRMPSTAPPRP
ncbi:MAG: hypothetical protein ACRELZ_18470, partial [Candidatus Rokuibacteriota bacterium]